VLPEAGGGVVVGVSDSVAVVDETERDGEGTLFGDIGLDKSQLKK
jgi:hypothetical protein